MALLVGMECDDVIEYVFKLCRELLEILRRFISTVYMVCIMGVQD